MLTACKMRTEVRSSRNHSLGVEARRESSQQCYEKQHQPSHVQFACGRGGS